MRKARQGAETLEGFASDFLKQTSTRSNISWVREGEGEGEVGEGEVGEGRLGRGR